MEASPSLNDLLNATQESAKLARDRISEILSLHQEQGLSNAQAKQLTAQTTAIEAAAIDIFSVFEARMQHHFKRGPFSRKLKAALLAAGNPDLADRIHQHYLAINVLKHGTGASYRELLNNKSTLFNVKQVTADSNDDSDESAGLVDVTTDHFFDRLVETILEAVNFLEGK